MRKRLLAIFLVALMLVSMLPVTAAAADEATWEEVELADIQPDDVIAITMHASYTNKNYALLNNGGTQTWGPAKVWDSSVTNDITQC